MRGLMILSALLAATPAIAQKAPAAREIAYGTDKLQKLDFYAAKGTSTPAPLVVFIHGGGWKRGDKGNATGAEKVTHFTGRGYAFASLNYRLVPSAKVEDQAQDVANALAKLVKDAGTLGFDPTRIVVMGHSAGAHLAALISTDPQYLQRAGMTLGQIDGVVLLDGAAYDVPAQMADGPRIMGGTYSEAFGKDPARQRALSPTLQAAAPNAPAFLILHVDRDDGTRQSNALAAALKAAGARAEVKALPGKGLIGHMQINRELGDPGYVGTPIVDAWVDGVLKR